MVQGSFESSRRDESSGIAQEGGAGGAGGHRHVQGCWSLFVWSRFRFTLAAAIVVALDWGNFGAKVYLHMGGKVTEKQQHSFVVIAYSS